MASTCYRTKTKLRALKLCVSPEMDSAVTLETRELEGFLRFTVRARIDAANGPVWAAPIYTVTGYTPGFWRPVCQRGTG